MDAAEFTVADYLLTRLLQLNVTEVFQIPGDYVKHFTQALEHFEGVEAIGTTNELDAAYAADAYGRTRGLAAMSMQFGVSTFSALNAVAGAYVEQSPIVVISAAPGSDARQIGDMYGVLYHHSTGNLDADRAIYEHVTVAAETLSTSAGAPEKIDALLTAALTHSKPVYIACYKEVWGEPCPRPSADIPQAVIPQSAPAALENAVEAAWTQITAAADAGEKCMIFAGVEILRHGLTELLEQLIDASGFVYTTTTLAKTVLDERGDKFIGTYSDAASIPAVEDLVKATDCFVTLGTIITDDYLWFVENKFADMVLATTTETRVGYFTYDNVTLQDFMEALLLRFRQSDSFPVADTAPAQPTSPEPWLSSSDPKYDAQPDTITYNRFFQHSMKFLDDNNLLDEIVWTFGVSCSLYVATNAYGLAKDSFLSSAAWQCIGFETGAASGAQFGSGKRAFTVAGDGGFMMTCQALSTLARNNLDAVIFVMSNGVYAIEQVYVDIDAFEPDGTFDTFDILPTWDYMALASAFGATGVQANTLDELDTVLESLKTRAPKADRKPTLVQVCIPEKDFAGQMKRLQAE